MEFTARQIADLLGGTVEGDEEIKVNTVAKIQDGKPGSVAFLSNQKYEQFLYTTKASAVLVQKDFEPKESIQTTLIRVEDPYSGFSALLEEYDKLASFQKVGVEEPSYVGENVTVGEGIYRGAFSYIGKGVTIGNNVKIYPHAYIGDFTQIGDNTIIYPGVKIYKNSIIGNHCTLHAGAVIGSDGFGWAPQDDGTYKKIPQVGNVILEDSVDIGANTTIDCATMDSTIIGEGVKLDNLIQVGHNVVIGKNTVMVAQAGISGSTTIGKNCIIAGQAGIIGHLEIADRVIVGAQAGVINSQKEEGVEIIGSPTISRKDYFRAYAIYRKLPDLSAKVRELEKKLISLQTIN